MERVIARIWIFVSMCALFLKIRNWGFLAFLLSLTSYFIFDDFDDFKCCVLIGASIPFFAQILFFITKFIVAPLTLSVDIHSEQDKDDLIYALRKIKKGIEENEESGN